MGFDEIRYHETVDLRNRTRAIREDLIPTAEALAEQAREHERRRSEPDITIEDHDAWPDETPDELNQLADTRRGEADAHERTLKALCPEHEFDSQVHDDHPCPGVECDHAESGYVLQELMAEESKHLTDDVVDQSMDIDVQRQTADASVKQGYQKVRLLQLALTDAPAEMPAAHDRDLGREVYAVGDMPDYTLEYLYDCAVALNDIGPEAVAGVGNLQDYGVSEDSIALVDEAGGKAPGDAEAGERESEPKTTDTA